MTLGFHRFFMYAQPRRKVLAKAFCATVGVTLSPQ